MRKGNEVAVFVEDNLVFIGIAESYSMAAHVVCGNKKLNSNIIKYMNEEINEYMGYIFIPVKEGDSKKTSHLRERARLRRCKARLAKMISKTASKLSDNDLRKIDKIMSKYY